MTAVRRVGSDLSYKDLVPGMRLVQKRKGIQYLVVAANANQILARMRRGSRGRFSTVRYDLVPAELIGFEIHQPE